MAISSKTSNHTWISHELTAHLSNPNLPPSFTDYLTGNIQHRDWNDAPESPVESTSVTLEGMILRFFHYLSRSPGPPRARIAPIVNCERQGEPGTRSENRLCVVMFASRSPCRQQTTSASGPPIMFEPLELPLVKVLQYSRIIPPQNHMRMAVFRRSAARPDVAPRQICSQIPESQPGALTDLQPDRAIVETASEPFRSASEQISDVGDSPTVNDGHSPHASD